ncbi:MAG: hypothetical protein HJJLKODD_02305 [Phycisphaerae bacterium]|nr:hypothetical protein [Phycisphaerae bacterium]
MRKQPQNIADAIKALATEGIKLFNEWAAEYRRKATAGTWNPDTDTKALQDRMLELYNKTLFPKLQELSPDSQLWIQELKKIRPAAVSWGLKNEHYPTTNLFLNLEARIDKLIEIAHRPVNQSRTVHNKKRGPKLKSDLKFDQRCYSAWQDNNCSTYAECAQLLKIPVGDFKLAVDRQRKRAGNIRQAQ